MTISRFIIFIKSNIFFFWKIVCNFCNRYGIQEISTIICGRYNIFVKYNILDWCQQHFVTPSSCCDLTRSRKSRGFFSPIIVDTTLVGLALMLQHAELTRLACWLQWPFEGPYEPSRMACSDTQNRARLVLHRVQRFKEAQSVRPKKDQCGNVVVALSSMHQWRFFDAQKLRRVFYVARLDPKSRPRSSYKTQGAA
jgi:hypothetical protein